MEKICFFVGDISASGGTERVTSIIANEFITQGYDVSILSLSNGEASYFHLNPKIKLYSLYSQKVNMKLHYIQTVFRLRRFVKTHKISVFIDVDSILSVFSIPALFRINTTHICWEHFNFLFDLGTPFRRWGRNLAARYCDYIVTLTRRDKELWISNLKKVKAQIIVINNPSPYQNIISKPDITNKLVLAIGRLTDQKGFDLLLEAWSLVIQDNPEWKLNIIGDGEQKKDLLQRIDKLNISTSVSIIPTTNEIKKFYQKASFYCLSSRFEGFPMVLLEAQAYGLPIVAFDCDTGPSDIIQDEVSGYLVEPLNIAKLAETINKMISSDVSIYNKMVFESKKNNKKYNVSKIFDSWLNIIKK